MGVIGEDYLKRPYSTGKLYPPIQELKNEQLENMIHVYEEHIDALEKENKQLKAQVDFLKEQLAYKTFGKPLDLEEEE